MPRSIRIDKGHFNGQILQILTDLNALPAGPAPFDAPIPAMIASCPGPDLIMAIGIGEF